MGLGHNAAVEKPFLKAGLLACRARMFAIFQFLMQHTLWQLRLCAFISIVVYQHNLSVAIVATQYILNGTLFEARGLSLSK